MTTKGAEMSKDLLVLADEYAAATATFARALALKDGADSMSPIAREAGDKRAVLAEALAAPIAQPPAPSDTAITYMTGYSDGREWAAAQLAAAQGQEPVDAVPLSDMVEGSHPRYGRGLFATDNCVKQFYAAPIPQQPSVPEGWKLVPIEPTEAMLEVGLFAENDVFDSAKTKRIRVWKDMLSAAPQPKEPK